VNYCGYDSDADRFRDESGEWQPWMDNRFEKVDG
jgi:hypothetical protein